VSTIGSLRVSRLSLSIGLTGSWRAEVWCDQGTAPFGSLTLTAADLSLKGYAIRSGSDAPDAPHVVHVGAPGWDREMTAGTTTSGGVTITSGAGWLAYQNDAGVRLSTVLRDLSRRAGEPIELPPDVTIGDHWTVIASRPGEPLYLRDALNALAVGRYVAPWRVDGDGVTRFGPRAGGVVDPASVNVIRRDMGAGLAVCGGDTFASILPGATFEGATIDRLVITERPGNLQAEIWTRAPSPFASIRRKVAEWFPALVYGYPRTYRVGAVQSDGRLDLDPPQDAPHLPPLARVEVWGLGGAKVKPRPGSLVAVCFRDANPARPYVHALQPLALSTPTETTISADTVKVGDGFARAVREGDTYTLGTATGVLTFVSTPDTNGASKVSV
jgi:hypothetical protein